MCFVRLILKLFSCLGFRLGILIFRALATLVGVDIHNLPEDMTHIIRLFSVSFNVFAPKIFPQKILSFLFQCLFLDFEGISINILAYFRIAFVFRAEFGYVRVAEAYFGTVRFFYNTCCLTGFSNRTSRSQNFVKIVQIILLTMCCMDLSSNLDLNATFAE